MGNSLGLKSPTVRLQTFAPLDTRVRISPATRRISLPRRPRAISLTRAWSRGGPSASVRSWVKGSVSSRPPIPEPAGTTPAQFRGGVGSPAHCQVGADSGTKWGWTVTEPSEADTVTTTDLEAGVLLRSAVAPRGTRTLASG